MNPKRKIILSRQSAILAEMRYVYRCGHRGTMSWPDVASACRFLRQIRESLLATDLDQRITRLEEAAKLRGRPGVGPVSLMPRSNGEGNHVEATP